MTTTTRNLWCRSRICQTRTSADVVIARYHPEGEYIVTGTKKYVYMQDQLGSVRDVIDTTTGTVVAAIDYSPYGKPTRTWGTVTPLFQYAGLVYHPQSGLNLATYRALDGAAGRWLNRDPIGESGGTNLYAYVGAGVVARADPLGLEPVKDQAGDIDGFTNGMDGSPSKIGTTSGASAASALKRLGSSSWGNPTATPYFNSSRNRYVYTKNGGWIDMVHFLFYAGRALDYKNAGSHCPEGVAISEGNLQEQLGPSHSAFGYEDLPSDRFGADFAVNFFDPNSKETLSGQIKTYFDSILGATTPASAPNYSSLPPTDSKNPPSARNRSTTPIYTWQR